MFSLHTHDCMLILNLMDDQHKDVFGMLLYALHLGQHVNTRCFFKSFDI